MYNPLTNGSCKHKCREVPECNVCKKAGHSHSNIFVAPPPVDSDICAKCGEKYTSYRDGYCQDCEIEIEQKSL